MEFLIAPKTQIITLIQSLVLTRGHWRFKGDHRLAATWTGSCSHRWVRSLMVWSAAGKAERGSVTVKAAGEAKAGWGCRLGRRVGGKTMKGTPPCQGGQRSRPSSLQRAQAGPRPRGDQRPAEWARQWQPLWGAIGPTCQHWISPLLWAPWLHF